MNKEELVVAIQDQLPMDCKATKKAINQILTATLEVIMEAVADGEAITLVGFGTFSPRERSERTGRNPQTGEPITIEATTVPGFKPGKIFKERLAA